jgi:hypothetical protein
MLFFIIAAEGFFLVVLLLALFLGAALRFVAFLLVDFLVDLLAVRFVFFAFFAFLFFAMGSSRLSC